MAHKLFRRILLTREKLLEQILYSEIYHMSMIVNLSESNF